MCVYQSLVNCHCHSHMLSSFSGVFFLSLTLTLFEQPSFNPQQKPYSTCVYCLDELPRHRGHTWEPMAILSSELMYMSLLNHVLNIVLCTFVASIAGTPKVLCPLPLPPSPSPLMICECGCAHPLSPRSDRCTYLIREGALLL